MLKTHKKPTRRSRSSYQKQNQLTITNSNFIVSYQALIPSQKKLRGGGNNIVVGTVVKYKIGELEEEVKLGSYIRIRKDSTGLV